MLYATLPLEIKAAREDGDYYIFEALAASYGTLDHGGDVFLPGVFAESLKAIVPVILWQHDRHEPIGMPVELKETDEGLFVKGALPKADTFVSGRVFPQLKIRSIRKMSVGYITEDAEPAPNGVRLIRKAQLHELSLVTFPMNEYASVLSVKNRDDILEKIKGADIFLEQEKEQIAQALQQRVCLSVTDLKNLESKEFSHIRELENALRESGAFSRAAIKLLSAKYSKVSLENDDDEFALEVKALSHKIERQEIETLVNSMKRKIGA
jgi:HK97 family phage prohead protease